MCLLMAAGALAVYLDHNKRFNVYTDASDFQLSACIIQEGRPVAYFLQKLMKSQQNYTTMEKEVLSIVATLEEFWNMLLDDDIHVFTDHKNMMFKTLKMQRVLCWHTKVEEFLPILHYIEGPCNILADYQSRLHLRRGRNLWSPQRLLMRTKTKRIYWIKNTVVFMMMSSWNVLSVISTYVTPHIRMRIHWVMHTFVKCSNRTNNCLLYK